MKYVSPSLLLYIRQGFPMAECIHLWKCIIVPPTGLLKYMTCATQILNEFMGRHTIK